jgi:hypothetical protein
VLTQTLFPFNFARRDSKQPACFEPVASHPAAAEIASQLQYPTWSARTPRCPQRAQREGLPHLNLPDLPVQIDDSAQTLGPKADDLGRIVFSLVEFQVVDAETAKRNEEGDSSHERYKKRQLKRVLRRLSRGLVVPARGRGKGKR